MIARFPTLRLEGGLIASDLIDQIADSHAPGQKAADFKLDSRHLMDEIAAVWTEARSFWSGFQHRLARLPEEDPATSQTRDQWMIPLLSLLGYELSYSPRAAEVDGQTFAISHRAGTGEDAPPIHIVGRGQPLDRRAESGRPRMAPHSLVQEYLNRTEHLWGMVSNGLTLRLLRDSHLIRRQSYIEFDLGQMMEGEKFADFALLYRLIHRSRLPLGIEDADECLLEEYHRLTVKQGGRVRERLREGVEEALRLLANAILKNPRNEELRERARSRRLDPTEFYQQLLRLIYRILFLMVAEERNLISASPVYREHYSISRLRRMTESRAVYTGHEDLWLGLQTVFQVFQDESLSRALSVAPLDGDLFNSARTSLLDNVTITNRELLSALWHLSMYREDNRAPWRRINYAALDVEELGSVYESLLDFEPAIFEQSGEPTFDFVSGTERKTTGSYYTPPELVAELIESALVPVIEDRLLAAKSAEDKERAILSIKACDPACGSGHFLLAAARRLGKELARVRTGEAEPAPEEQREAIRRVIANCIYGVDRNPLAVDLCKVALWIEGNTEGKPLTFIDHRICCGDSLVGVSDLAVLEEGIPDKAFDPVVGDDKKIARRLKRQNSKERSGQMVLGFEPSEELHALTDVNRELMKLSDDDVEQVKKKAEIFERSRSAHTKWWLENRACHLWTTAFFTEITEENENQQRIATTSTLREYLVNPKTTVHIRTMAEAEVIAEQMKFFHWPLEFPEVFDSGGFDVVIGNPPFVAGVKISNSFGEHYRKFITRNYEPFKGQADLCAAFFRRGFTILGRYAMLGMVATNTISQGDTRESGLAVISRKGGRIVFAHRFIKWQGAANVEVNLLTISKAMKTNDCVLDGEHVESISSRLDTDLEVQAQSLRQNTGKGFRGLSVGGEGFIIQPDESRKLIMEDYTNCECILPFLNGEDFNNRFDQSASRSIICFFQWPLEKAQEYPSLLQIIEERVKPYRMQSRAKREREKWWQFARPGTDLKEAVATLERVIIRSRVSELHMLAFVPKSSVFADTIVVFAFDDDYHFALLQSNVHEAWVRRSASTMRTDIRYTPTDCFDTFSFPQDAANELKDRAAEIGGRYHEHRRQMMIDRNIGLTKTYNLFHNAECKDEDISCLRNMHAAIDRAVLDCYGWTNLDPQHGFHINERGQTRYTISPDARRETIRRLIELNLQISAQEMGRGKNRKGK